MYNHDLIPGNRVACKQLSGLPKHDTLWDLCMAPDDTLYIGACVEYTGGMSAVLCSYHRSKDRIEYLADMADVTGESPDSGHATQGKIHFSLCCGNEGLIYGATHCTTAPKGEKEWSAFIMYCDPVRNYPGAHLFVHDSKTLQTSDLGILIPNEGVRVMTIDRQRNLLHGTTFPKCHYFVCDLEKKKLADLGRFGNVHQLSLFIDDEGNAYTTDSFGWLIRCDAGGRRLRRLDIQLPHAPFRRGEHNVLWQAVKQPGTGIIYGATYTVDARLFRYEPKTNKMTDLGVACGYQYDPTDLERTYPGGMTFGKDGFLYYTIGEVCPGEARRGHIIRYDTSTNEAEDLGVLIADGMPFSGNCNHAQTDSKGNIYIAQGGVPPRFFIYMPEGNNE